MTTRDETIEREDWGRGHRGFDYLRSIRLVRDDGD